ncbi:hypothetical protein EUGRSUZ_J02421, partial [Eucalyptus grandis]
WELRFFVLLSLFLQLILVTQGFRRKSSYKCWIRVVVWTAYPLADLIATLTLGVLLNRLATIKETKGTIDPKSHIAAYWVPFLLLHLGGPDTITAYALKDIELWLRQLARLCVHVGLACYAYFVTFSGSTLSILAAGVILVGFIKYVERTLCLYWATEGQLRDSMLSLPDFEYPLKKEEGYRLSIDEESGQAIDKEKDSTLVKAYELFKIFKPLFVGLILSSGDLEASKRMFMNKAMDSATAFSIVEIQLGFMYDQLFTKALLLTRAWGIIRWVINLSVLCAVLVFFSLQDRKDYPKVDVYITFLLIGAAVLLEIYSVLLAISSDWVNHWRLQRSGGSAISSAVAFLQICQTPRWSNSVAQFSLLKFSVGKRNRIFSKYLRLTKLDEELEKNFYIDYKEFKSNIKEWTFDHMRDTVDFLFQDARVKSGSMSLKLEALKSSKNDHLDWSVKGMEFERSILIWHIATELCHYKDHDKRRRESPENIKHYKMSRLVSRYMLYLLVYHPFMLQPGIHAPRYTDTLVDAQKFFQDKLAVLSKKETIINLSVVKTWAQNLFEKEKYGHTGVKSCNKAHKSAESRDLCELGHLLLHVGTQLPAEKIRSAKSRSVLFDGCHLTSQLNEIESKDFGRKWHVIGKVWAKFLIYAACKSKGYEHCKNLNNGGELISHVWLLMAHLGVAELVQTSEGQCITKLILD